VTDHRFLTATLVFGLAAGIALTAYGLLQKRAQLPAESVAVVNGQVIPRDLYERVVEGIAADREGTPVTAADRDHVLQRMIDEELLVQEAVTLGMASRDRLARGYLVQAMIDFVGQRVQQETPSESDLESFYAEHKTDFSRPGRLALRAMQFDVYPGQPDEAGQKRVVAALEALARGEAWETVRKAHADEPVVRLPTTPLSAANVMEYLGPTATRAAFALTPGKLSEPLRVKTGYLLLEVLQRWDDQVPPFAEVRDEVAATLRRKRSEEALREYVDDLRRSAVIETR
jgi:hypothetical protein